MVFRKVYIVLCAALLAAGDLCAQQVRVEPRIAGLEGNREYMSLLEQDAQLQIREDSIVNAVERARQQLREDPANRQRYSQEILQLESRIFEVRNAKGRLIDKINTEQEAHIITLEDPLEYLHTHKKSIVSQREICTDTENYLTALRASLRQSPDVILLGEMRDYETINTAMTAAETGHLIFSTLHTIGAANTIDRIIDAFPAAQQHQVAVQLSMVLHAVISQRLLPTTDGKMVPAFEIMVLTPAIRNIIREGKTHQIDGMIYTSTNENMLAMDTSIFRLYQKGIVDKKTALANASNPEMMSKKIGAI